MATDDRTATRQYLLPNPQNKLKDDVERLRSALSAIDGDVTDILLELGLRAPLEHGHDIEDVTSLQDALDDKVSISGFSLDLDNLADVNAPAPTGNQVLMRVGSFWIPATIQVNHISGLETALTGLSDAVATRWNAAVVAAAPSKATPVDTDVLPLVDSVLKKVTWGNIKATLKTYMDTLYSAVGHTHAWSVITGKPTTRDGYGITDVYTTTQSNSLVNGNMAGRAYPRRSDGTGINIIWSGQGGTPQWVLAGADGVNFYPYNPAGFNVASVGGWDQPTIANVIEQRASAWAATRQAPPYTGDWQDETNFPIGHYLWVHGAFPARNAAVAFGLSGTGKYFTGASGVAGTWRTRGLFWDRDGFLAQRVA